MKKGDVRLQKICWTKNSKSKPRRNTWHASSTHFIMFQRIIVKTFSFLLSSFASWFTLLPNPFLFQHIFPARGDSVPSLPPWHQYVHTGAEVCFVIPQVMFPGFFLQGGTRSQPHMVDHAQTAELCELVEGHPRTKPVKTYQFVLGT